MCYTDHRTNIVKTEDFLRSEVTRERIHRLEGWLFVVVGLLGIPFSFLPMFRVWGLVILLILVCVFLYIYSYVCYRQHTAGESEPLSPPFDEANRE